MAAWRDIKVSYLSLHLLITDLKDDGIPSLKLDTCSNATITTLIACVCVCVSECVHVLMCV